MTVYTTVGTRLDISETLPAAYTAAGYGALTAWNEIGEVTDLGDWGATGSTASHQPLASGETVNAKAFLDWGQRDITLGRDITDAGQDLLKDLSDDPAKRYNIVAIRITHQSGLVQYTTAQITTFTTNLGGGDSIVNATVGISSRSRLIDVKP